MPVIGGPRNPVTPPTPGVTSSDAGTATGSADGAAATADATPVAAPTGVDATPDVGVGTTGGAPSSDGSSLTSRALGKVKTKLVERTWKEITAQRDVTLANLDLGDHGSLGIRLREKIFRSDDAVIQGDPLRKATTESLAASTGKDVVWARTGGLIRPQGGLSTSVPVSGIVNVRAGFSASGLLEYRAMHPYPVSTAAAGDLLKDHSVELPLSADKARALEAGVQLELIGQGTVSLSAGVGAGASTSVGPVTGSVGVSVGGSTTRQGTWALNITRLEDDKVRVVLSEVKSRTRSADLTLNAGLSIDGDDVIDKTVGGTLDAHAGDVGLDGVLGNLGVSDDGLAGLLKREGASRLEKAVRNYTAFHASVGSSATETREEKTSYVFDLSQPGAQAAYEKLLRLDEGAAALAAADTTSGVSRHIYSAVGQADADTAHVSFAGKKLLLFKALRAEKNGQLTTADGTRLIRTSKYERTYNGFVTGDKDIKWEGVSTRDASGANSEHFFHMRFVGDDKITHDSEIKAFVRFADLLGIPGADVNAIDLPDTSWFGRLFGSDDNTRFRSSIYFTDDGVRTIANTSGEEARTAFANAAAAINPKLAGVPVNDPAAIKHAKEYFRAEQEKEDARGDRDFEQRADDAMRWAGIEYKRLTGRKLDKDIQVFRGADQLEEAVGKMSASGDDQGWASFFGELGKTRRFDYMPSIGALALLAGPEDTLIHELSMEGNSVHLVAENEGSLRHPDADVTAAIDHHD